MLRVCKKLFSYLWVGLSPLKNGWAMGCVHYELCISYDCVYKGGQTQTNGFAAAVQVSQRCPSQPHGGLRPFHQMATCITHLTFGRCAVRNWSRYGRNIDPTKPAYPTEWLADRFHSKRYTHTADFEGIS